MSLLTQHSLEELHSNLQLLKKYTKEDFSSCLESLIVQGDVIELDSFLSLPFPPKKAVGVHLWNAKSHSFSFYESYICLALKHKKVNIFEYFYSQKEFSTNTILDRMCSEDNLDMIDFILSKYPPNNVSQRADLLNSAMNDGFVEQFRLLCTHDKNPINIYEKNYEIFRKACMDNKNAFITILMIDCHIELNQNIMNWLNGDNSIEMIFEFPLKLLKLRELNKKLTQSLNRKNLSKKDIKIKI